MTDLTQPAEADAATDNTAWGHALGKAGTGAWIVDGVDIANIYAALDETQLNAFLHSATTGLDVTIDAGEAYVSGWLCRDRATMVTLPASSTTTIYVGYDASAVIDSSVEAPSDNDNIIVGPAGDFAGEDPRTELYTFTTDASTVTSSEDHRKLTQPIEYDAVDNEFKVRGGSEFRLTRDDTNIAGDTLYRSTGIFTEAAVDSAASAVGMVGRRSRGTSLDNPQPSQSGDWLMLVGGDARNDNSEFVRIGDITVRAAGAPQGTNGEIVPGQINFRTRDTDDSNVTRLIIRDDGVLDASPGEGIVPPDINGGSLPSDTETGRIVYDSSREQ